MNWFGSAERRVGGSASVNLRIFSIAESPNRRSADPAFIACVIFGLLVLLVGGLGNSLFAATVVGTPSVTIDKSRSIVTWTTDVPTDSLLMWGTTDSGFYSSVYDPALTTSHRVVTSDLLPAQTYFAAPGARSQAITNIDNVHFSFTMPPIDQTAPTDFSFTVVSGLRVTRGHGMYLRFDYAVTSGNPVGDISFSWATPSGITISPHNGITTVGDQPNILSAYLSAGAAMAPGDYSVTFRATFQGLTKTVVKRIRVEALPNPLAKRSITSIPPIPGLKEWESHMVADTFATGLYGGKHFCDEQQINQGGLWEGGVWYYDGSRVYQQIAEYTKDPSWYQCADYVEKLYGDYVRDSVGKVPPWRNFGHGFFMKYKRTGSAYSHARLMELASFWMPHDRFYIDQASIRELTYAFASQTLAARLGESVPTVSLERNLDALLSIFDQQFVSETDTYHKPFMIGLAMEALIQYYDYRPDPRIPVAIKLAADWMLTHMWDPNAKAFAYNDADWLFVPTADLSLLIAPAYAWLWAMTGDPIYQQRGDEAFEAGVKNAWLGAGKQFSQSYRWSFDYVKWRQNPQSVFASLSNVSASPKLSPRVYPNPWRADRHPSNSSITFDRLNAGTEIKIFTVAGHLVRSLPKADSQVSWDLRNESGQRVASGVYLYSAKDAAGETARGKLAVVR